MHVEGEFAASVMCCMVQTLVGDLLDLTLSTGKPENNKNLCLDRDLNAYSVAKSEDHSAIQYKELTEVVLLLVTVFYQVCKYSAHPQFYH